MRKAKTHFSQYASPNIVIVPSVTLQEVSPPKKPKLSIEDQNKPLSSNENVSGVNNEIKTKISSGVSTVVNVNSKVTKTSWATNYLQSIGQTQCKISQLQLQSVPKKVFVCEPDVAKVEKKSDNLHKMSKSTSCSTIDKTKSSTTESKLNSKEVNNRVTAQLHLLPNIFEQSKTPKNENFISSLQTSTKENNKADKKDSKTKIPINILGNKTVSKKNICQSQSDSKKNDIFPKLVNDKRKKRKNSVISNLKRHNTNTNSNYPNIRKKSNITVNKIPQSSSLNKTKYSSLKDTMEEDKLANKSDTDCRTNKVVQTSPIKSVVQKVDNVNVIHHFPQSSNNLRGDNDLRRKLNWKNRKFPVIVTDNLIIKVPNNNGEHNNSTTQVSSTNKNVVEPVKTLKLIINLVCTKRKDSVISTNDREMESHQLASVDLSFLDDFNVDEIVECLNYDKKSITVKQTDNANSNTNFIKSDNLDLNTENKTASKDYSKHSKYESLCHNQEQTNNNMIYSKQSNEQLCDKCNHNKISQNLEVDIIATQMKHKTDVTIVSNQLDPAYECMKDLEFTYKSNDIIKTLPSETKNVENITESLEYRNSNICQNNSKECLQSSSPNLALQMPAKESSNLINEKTSKGNTYSKKLNIDTELVKNEQDDDNSSNKPLNVLVHKKNEGTSESVTHSKSMNLTKGNDDKTQIKTIESNNKDKKKCNKLDSNIKPQQNFDLAKQELEELDFKQNLFRRMQSYLGVMYNIGKLIRDGKYSRLYKIHKEDSGETFAIKALHSKITGRRNENMLTSLQKDIPKENFKIIRVIDGFATLGRWCLVMEYYPRNLRSTINNNKCLQIYLVQRLAKQLISAIVVLRNYNIIHTDIKPEHILLNNSLSKLKLCGFDEAQYADAIKLVPSLGTASYRAPEMILGFNGTAAFSIDVWSAALVIYEMATSRQLFPGRFNNDILFKQMCTLGNMPHEMVENSYFKNYHFSGPIFKRKYGFKGKNVQYIENFERNNTLTTAVFEAYYKSWGISRPDLRKNKEINKIKMLNNLLEQMLNFNPIYRIPIEFVYANSFILEH